MGAKISVQKIEELSAKKVKKLKASTVRQLQPDVKAIYDRRIAMILTTVEDMENFDDILKQNFSQRDMKDLRPEVRAVYEKRVEHQNRFTYFLRNLMDEVPIEDVQTVNMENEE